MHAVWAYTGHGQGVTEVQECTWAKAALAKAAMNF